MISTWASGGRKPPVGAISDFIRQTGGLRPPLALILLLLVIPPVRAELRLDQPVIDAGQVRGGPALVKRFTFRNDGPASIEITDARAGCGCLTPRLSKKQFAPAEEGWVDVEINTLTQPAGPNHWKVQIVYRDGDRPAEAMLQVNALLTKEVLVEPAALNILTEQGITHEITVTDLRPKPLTVIAVRSSNLPLRCQLQPARRDAGGRPVQVIRLEVGADYPEGKRDEIVSIFTDDPAYAEMRLPVIVTKRGKQRITAAPREVVLRAPAGQPIPSRIVLLRDAENQPVLVEKITADNPAVQLRWAEGPGPMATLKVQVDAGQLPAEGIESTIHVQLRQPIPQTLNIPIHVNQSGKPRSEKQQ